jgi:hypothetical protein
MRYKSMLGSLLFLASMIALLNGCFPSTTRAKPEKKVPTPARTAQYELNYEPTPQENPIEATLALISPIYAARDVNCEPQNEAMNLILDDYAKKLGLDVEETLLAKNYTLIGPFANIDEMVFGDKEKAALALQPTITLTVNCNADAASAELFDFQFGQFTGETQEYQGGNYRVYQNYSVEKYVGNAMVSASIVLPMVEPLSQEKIWQKSIDLPSATAPYSYFLYSGVNKLETRQVSDSGEPLDPVISEFVSAPETYDERPAVIADLLESFYVNQLETFSQYFDPNEIAIAVEEALRAKELKRF